MTARKPLEYYLEREYSFDVMADPEGGYVIKFPDLPGCLTQVDSLEEIPFMVDDARRLWIETAYEEGIEIPEPTYPEEYSGKFIVRTPRSLHRSLVEAAERDGVSLNQYTVMLLARGDSQARLESWLVDIKNCVDEMPGRLRYVFTGSEPTKEFFRPGYLADVRALAA